MISIVHKISISSDVVRGHYDYYRATQHLESCILFTSNCKLRFSSIRGLPSMTSALEGGRGVVEKWTRVLISCVIMYVTRGEGVKKFQIFMDVIDGSPLS